MWTWQLAPGETADLVFSTEETDDDPAAVRESERRRRDLFPKTGDRILDEVARRADSFLVDPETEPRRSWRGSPGSETGDATR